MNQQETSTGPGHTGPHATASSNRYILLAVLAVAVVVAIWWLKNNLRPASIAPVTDEAMDTAVTAEPFSDSASTQNMMQQIAHVRGILAQDSSNFDAWAALGNLFFDAQMPNEAIAHYQHALLLRPDDLDVMTDLATMEREAGRPQDAVATLKRVVAIDSMHVQAWFNLGVMYNFDLQRPKDAIAAWKNFLALSPASEHTEAIRREIERLEKDSAN